VTSRPAIFISAVSKELRGARQLVANTLTFLGYEPVWQDIFGTESGDLRAMLRQQIDECKGVVQLVGQCYGAEPPNSDQEFGRVSYTQYEALYARKRGKKVWYLFMDESFPVDAQESEPEELRQLQTSYRDALKTDTHLFHPLASKEALEAGVLKLRSELTQLRRSAKRWAAAVASLLGLIALMVVWLVRGQGETKKAVTGITAQMAKEGGSLEIIAKRFDALASMGGLIAAPKTPEEHYHNARVDELGGNFSAARREYSEYLSANLDALDPWLSYTAMLKTTEGHAGAIEAMRDFGNKLHPRTISYQTALAMLEDGDARLSKLTALAASHPEFGPLPWLISQEYSETRRGDQTLADKRAEKEWLQKFRAAQDAGKFQRYFLDKKEAQKWVDAAEARWAKLSSTPERVLENPVSLTAQESNSGWAVTFSLADFKAKELFYRLDGKGDFKSTGHLPYRNPQTGLPMVNLNLPLPDLAPGTHTIEAKYLDKDELMNGPYTLKFSTTSERLAQGKMMLESASGAWLSFRDYDGKVLLYFTTLMSYRPIIKEVRYSLNSDALDKTFKFKPTDKMYEVGDEIYITVPNDSRFASVQVTYKDDTTSAIQKVVRQK
jgi:Domain of unknown function (DUF4062)